MDKIIKNLLNKDSSQYFHDSSKSLVALTSVYIGVLNCYSTPMLPKTKTELSNIKMIYQYYF